MNLTKAAVVAVVSFLVGSIAFVAIAKHEVKKIAALPTQTLEQGIREIPIIAAPVVAPIELPPIEVAKPVKRLAKKKPHKAIVYQKAAVEQALPPAAPLYLDPPPPPEQVVHIPCFLSFFIFSCTPG